MTEATPRPTNEFGHLWNDLPMSERTRIYPFLIESKLLHLWQTRQLIIKGHERTLADLDAQMANLRRSLNAARTALAQARKDGGE